MEHSSTRDFTIPERWTLPTRGIRRFLSGGSFLRVGFRDFRAVDPPAREISLFPSGGTFQRVRFCNSWVMELSRAWNSAISGRWTLPARRIPLFLSGGPLPRVGFGNS